MHPFLSLSITSNLILYKVTQLWVWVSQYERRVIAFSNIISLLIVNNLTYIQWTMSKVDLLVA